MTHLLWPTVLLEPSAPSQCLGNARYYAPISSPQFSQNQTPADAVVPSSEHVRVTTGDVLVSSGQLQPNFSTMSRETTSPATFRPSS